MILMIKAKIWVSFAGGGAYLLAMP